MPTLFDLQQELEQDPAGLGYKNPDGTFKSTREILHLMTSRRQTGVQQVQVPDPPTFGEVMAQVSPTSLAKIPDETLVRIRQVLDARDMAGAQAWLDIAQVKGYVTSAEASAIQGLLARTKTVEEPVYSLPRIVELGWGSSINPDLINNLLGRPSGTWE